MVGRPLEVRRRPALYDSHAGPQVWFLFPMHLLEFHPNSAVFCPASGKVELCNASHPTSPVATLSTTGTPQDITYDPAAQNFYVAESAASHVGWLSAIATGVLGQFSVLAPSSFIAYDASLSELFVGGTNSSVYTYGVARGSLTLVGSVSLPTEASPEGIAYDGAFGEMFVTITNQGIVSVVNDSARATVGSGCRWVRTPRGSHTTRERAFCSWSTRTRTRWVEPDR